MLVPLHAHAQAPLRDADAMHASEMAQLEQQYGAATMTTRSMKSGVWSDPATWSSGVPTATSRAMVGSGHTVTVDTTTAVADTVRVEGTLRFDPRRTTRLTVETIYGAMSSRLEMGTASDPVALPQSATLVFRSSGKALDHKSDPFEFGRGLVTMGLLETHGQAKTGWVATSRTYSAGATTLALDSAPSGWQVGDRLLITAPHFGQDEVRTIAAISGATVTLSSGLTYARRFPAVSSPVPPFAFHVGNLTRNVTIQSDAAYAGQPAHQGHVMLMHRGGHQIRYTRFADLGRTHIISPVSDPRMVGGQRDPQLMPLCGVIEENPRGRYGLHFHVALPTSTASVVENIVLENRRNSGIRIGIQNHSSHVRVRDSVVYQIDGFGLFTEEGDERGEYRRNLVVYSKGHDASLHEDVRDQCMLDYDYRDILSRRRLAVGWRGGGIWLHGGQVDVVGNVVAGHDNAGIDIWERPLHHMACIFSTCNTFKVQYPTALLREGTNWVPDFYQDAMVDNSVPPFLVADNQIYAIGGPGKNRSRVAVSMHYMKVWESWVRHYPGRPRNLLARNLVWNVVNGVATTYTEYARLIDNVFIQGDLLEANVGPFSKLSGTGVRMHAQGGEQHDYVRLRIDGFQQVMTETPASCYEAVRFNGVLFTPSQYPQRSDCGSTTTSPPPAAPGNVRIVR
jgi:hypothetical protein